MPDTSPLKSSLSFAKLVATPTETAWSQAYNAGNLFVCLTLIKDETDEDISLQTLGKESINNLEAEFFTLEEKNTESIKKALIASLENIPPEVKKHLTVANYKNDVLTVFIAGSGKVILKRGDTIGTILERYDEYIQGDITSASGYLNNKDIIILESGQFAKKVPEETIKSALKLSLPIDIVETLTPQIHGQKDGAQSAIVVLFHSSQAPMVTSPDLAYPADQSLASLYTKEKNNDDPTLEESIEAETSMEEELDEYIEDEKKEKKKMQLPHFSMPKWKKQPLRLNHRKKLYLTIAAILAFLLIVSIFMAVQKQKDAQQKAIFENTYIPAKQYYEEGQGLESLNQLKSQESYKKAEQRLHEGEERIDRNSPEGKQIQELLAKVEDELNKAVKDEPPADAKEASANENSLLAIEQKNNGGLGFGQDGKNVYMVDKNAITSFSKANAAKKEVLKNNSDWEIPTAIAPYQTNLYVLDQKKGVLKIIGGTTVSNYFTAEKPDLTSATGLAIDGSIWIVTKDGKILKYTKAKKDTFTLSGMTRELKSPTKIVTTAETEYLYILDNGNNRIVKTDKKGSFQKEITAPFISQAKDFEVVESEKKAYILSGSKIYELAL